MRANLRRSWLKNLAFKLFGGESRRLRKRLTLSRAMARRPRRSFERLECRLAMTAFTVTDAADTAGNVGDVTLRYAVNHAQNGDQIAFAGSLSGDTITLGSTLTINTNVAITGLGAQNLAINGNNAVRVFTVGSGVTASISGLTITNGSSRTGSGINNSGTLSLSNDTISNNGTISNTANTFGAGIYNSNTGIMTISGCAITGNTTYTDGGGIYNRGTMTLSNSTVFGNAAYTSGGGIYNSGTLTLSNDTVSGNFGWNNIGSLPDFGGGIFNNNSGTLHMSNTIVAGNITSENGPDIYGAVAAGGTNNLVGTGSGMTGLTGGVAGNQVGIASPINPLLGSLAYNGGPTETLALQAGSPAIGAGAAVTTVDIGGIAATGNSITLTNGAAIASTSGNYYIQIDSEQMLVTTVSGNTLTVTRGYNGTGETTHSSGAGVFLEYDQRGYAINIATPDIGAYQTTGAVPTVTSISPTSGSLAGGTSVTITGTNLGNATEVDFGGVAGTIVSDTGTVIVATTPAEPPGIVDTTVTVAGTLTTATSTADQFTFGSDTTTSIIAPSIIYGASGSVTVTVSSTAITSPTGSVSLSVDGGTAITQTLSAGSTIFTLPSLSATTHSLSASYTPQGLFLASSNTGTLLVNQAPSTTTTVGASPFTYTGSAQIGGSGTVTGAGGLSTVATSLTYSANADGTGTADQTDAGTYYVTAHYAGDANHTSSDGSAVAITIGQANSTTTTVGAGPFTYTGSAQAGGSGTVTGAGSLSTVASSLTYSANADGTGTADQTDAGTYYVIAHYAGDANHLASDGAAVAITIGKANAIVVITPYTATYDHSAHSAAVTSITGVNSETGAAVGSVSLSTTHTNIGTYATDSWSFTGAANYNDIATTTITDTITPFSLQGATLTVFGNSTYEHLQVVFSDATHYTVTLDGVSQSYTTAQANTVYFAGPDNNATVAVTDTFNALTANIGPKLMSISAASYTIQVAGVAINSISGTSADSADLLDGPGHNRFYGTPTSSLFVNDDIGTSFAETVNGFGSVYPTQSIGSDIAYLYDAAGSNTFASNQSTSTLSGTGYAYTVGNFRYVLAYATSGSNDTASLDDNDTSGNNIFESHQAYSVFYGPTFYNQVSGFTQIAATTTSSADLAFLYDSTGDSRFYGQRDNSVLANTDAGSGYSIQVNQFAHVGANDVATAGAPADSAYLYDSANGQDRFYGHEFKSYLANADAGTSFYYEANSFAHVFVPKGTANDTAYLYDSPGNDTFDAYPDHSILYGSDYYTRLDQFGTVYAYSSGGNDVANLFASTGNDTFNGFVNNGGYQSVLQGTGYYVGANNFAIVNVVANSIKDVAYLYDSPGNDNVTSYQSENQLIVMQYPSNVINLSNFGAVQATSSQGGKDTTPATKPTAPDYVFQTVGNWVYD
jgi:hypothetical protein